MLLNDPTYAEAARALALRILKDGGAAVPAHIQFAYRLVLARDPRPAEEAILTQLYAKHRGEFAADLPSARDCSASAPPPSRPT